jgi:ubiquinone/menaquinone biosynthesis C-methylase UbiE
MTVRKNRRNRRLLEFLSKIEFEQYLEVGAGKGNFVRQVYSEWPNALVGAVDISYLLVRQLRDAGILAVCGDARQIPFGSDLFDVVNCSHLIEHFDYKDVKSVLDELVRTAVPGGFIVIRTPLLWRSFYDDLDHVRPYSATAILNYFREDLQAQAVSKHRVELDSIWYRYSPVYLVDYYYKGHNRLVRWINAQLRKAFDVFGFPRAPNPTGYTMIIRKLE